MVWWFTARSHEASISPWVRNWIRSSMINRLFALAPLAVGWWIAWAFIAALAKSSGLRNGWRRRAGDRSFVRCREAQLGTRLSASLLFHLGPLPRSGRLHSLNFPGVDQPIHSILRGCRNPLSCRKCDSVWSLSRQSVGKDTILITPTVLPRIR
jgi:hypothetical protein